nr:MAG TPA: hypothetical protein [Herelleviridae sp.]
MLFGNVTNNIKSLCQGCDARHVGCHSQCQSYASYRAKIDANQAIRIAKYNEHKDVLSVMSGMTKARIYGGV